MRVLIVDDEYKVCQLIQHLVRWEEYGMEVIGMASDGEAAFEIICREKPDIVITDIQMPGIDGIQLVEKTNQVLKNVFFVIVSGYSQFEYARQAVKLGVEDYLVKPIRKRDLDAVLQKISGKYKKEMDSHEEKENLKTELVLTREKIKNKLLQDLLFSKEPDIQNAEIKEIEKRYGCSFKGSCYRMILVHVFENSMESDRQEQIFVMNRLQKVLRERLEPFSAEFFYTAQGSSGICLVNMEDSQDNELNRQLMRTVTDLSSIREIFPDARMAAVLGKSMEDFRTCREYLSRLQMILLRRFRKGNQVIFQDIEEPGTVEDYTNLITADRKKRFLLELEILDTEGIGRQLDEIKELLQRQTNDPECWYRVWSEIVELFLLGVRNYYEGAESLQMEEYLKGFEVFYTYDAVLEWMKQKMVRYVEEQAQKRKEAEARPIRIAKKYINDHFTENIKLEMVSKEVGLNPAYFSSVFKKDTGQSFTEYVVSVRMENAKRLLLETNWDVVDIADEVGYGDVKYFTKLFKKSTSLTPTEYRKLYN